MTQTTNQRSHSLASCLFSKNVTVQAFFTVLRFPLMQFGDVINGVLQGKVALRRITSFLSIHKTHTVCELSTKSDDTNLIVCVFGVHGFEMYVGAAIAFTVFGLRARHVGQIVRDNGSSDTSKDGTRGNNGGGGDIELAEVPSSSPTLPGKISIPGTDFSWLDKKAIREAKAKQLQLRSSWRPGEDASNLMRMVRTLHLFVCLL